jgi:hypothetical protein
MWKAIAGVLLFLGLVFGIGWAVQGNQFFMYKVFAPKEAAVQREVFEQSKSYNEGKLQELRKAQLDYAKAATPEQKLAIGSYALHQVAGYDESRLPEDLKQFVQQLRVEQAGGVR